MAISRRTFLVAGTMGGMLVFAPAFGLSVGTGVYKRSKNGIGTLTGVAAEVARYLLKLNFSKHAVAGILGNIRQESELDPTLYGGDGTGNGATSLGLFQFTRTNEDDEITPFLAWCDSHGYNWQDVETQLKWVFSKEEGTATGFWFNRWSIARASGTYYEYDTGYESNMRTDFYQTEEDFKNSTDYKIAVYSWMAAYEGPGSRKSYGYDASRLDKRIGYAAEFYQRMCASVVGSGDFQSFKALWEQHERQFLYSWGSGRLSPDTSGYTDCGGCVYWGANQIGDYSWLPQWTGMYLDSTGYWSAEMEQYKVAEWNYSLDLSVLQPGDFIVMDKETRANDHGHIGVYWGDEQFWGAGSAPAPKLEGTGANMWYTNYKHVAVFRVISCG